MDKNNLNANVIININEEDQPKNNNNISDKKGIRKRIFEIIELSKDGDIVSSIYDFIMIIVIIITIIPLVVKEENELFNYIDIVSGSIFIIDYILRLMTADYKLEQKGTQAFLKYPLTIYAIIDLLSILPSFTAFCDGLKLLRIINLIKTLKVIRIFKSFRYNSNINIIGQVIKKSKKPLTVVCGLALGYILISALIIFNIESDTFDNFFDAIYWATISLTTVGYGDIHPTSIEGKVVAMVSSICGIALIALPAGVVTAGYMETLSSNLEKKIQSSINLSNNTINDNNYDNDDN